MENAAEMYKKHRPTMFKQVIGQDTAVKTLTSMLKKDKVPHTILFTGHSGSGKTTLARIMVEKLGCIGKNFEEVNAAKSRGIDTIRDIDRRMGSAPLGGKCRIWLFDECQKLSNDAQNSLLKMLEDTPLHVYFLLCTTDPGKLIDAIKTRCTEIRCVALKPESITKILVDIGTREGNIPTTEVMNKIIEVSEGSARKALVLLNQVMDIDDPEEQIEAVLSSYHKEDAFKICSMLLRPETKWPDMAALLKEINLDEPEGLRHLVLSYMRSCMLGKKGEAPKDWTAKRAFFIMNIFRDNLYDAKGPGFVRNCFEVLNAGRR